jgi:hypothetical protein
MGALAHFDLNALMTRYKILHFVETGTGSGQGLQHASRFAFRSLRSCEMVEQLANVVSQAFKSDNRISVRCQDSETFLSVACDMIPADEPILFWLDAHFPGADYGLTGYGSETSESVRLPLRRELEIISELRPGGRDAILVDDLRIWIDAAFGSGNLPANVRPFCPRNRDASFFSDILGKTHDIKFDYAQEGYVVATPMEIANAGADQDV